MNANRAQLARTGLLRARGFIVDVLERIEHPPAELVGVLLEVDRGIGATLEKNAIHDSGAFAQCSHCHRYSADPASIVGGHSPPAVTRTPRCDCGRDDGWTGHFLPPGPAARWSTGLSNLNGREQ